VLQRKAQNFTARGVRPRKQIKRIITAEARGLDLIAELRDLLPRSIRPEQVMSKVAAVAIGDCGQDIFAVARPFELDLRDSGKVFA
jgi:hypothetical protein